VGLQLDGARGATKAEELRFDGQGNALEARAQPLEGGKGGGSPALQLQLDGAGVRLYRLTYD
jgi:hypothetical protein